MNMTAQSAFTRRASRSLYPFLCLLLATNYRRNKSSGRTTMAIAADKQEARVNDKKVVLVVVVVAAAATVPAERARAKSLVVSRFSRP